METQIQPSRWYGVLLLSILSVAAVASTVGQQHHRARAPKTLRLYVFDCGVIKGLDPALFNFKKEELAETELAVPCYLIADPKGTLMWDVGVIPDSAFKDDGKPVTQGVSTVTRTLKSQLAEIGYSPVRHHLSGPLALSRRSHCQFERVRQLHVAGAQSGTRRDVRREASGARRS